VLAPALFRLSSGLAAAPFSFIAPMPYNVGAGNSGPYWAASFNRFGKPAIAVTNQTSNSVSVLYGNYVNGQYDGTFGAANTYSLVTGAVTNPGPQQVVVGNLGQAGLPCLVVAAANAGRIAVLLGNPDESFQSTPVYYSLTAGAFPESVALGDVNGDTNLDIIAANYSAPSNVTIFLGNSDRTFQSPTTVAVSTNPESVVVADFNNDGKLDIATCTSASSQGKVSVLLGNGNGTFQAEILTSVGGSLYNLATGDLNADGKLDIVTVNHGGGVTVLLNNGVRPFPATAPASLPAGAAPYSVAVADINYDGLPDIVVANGDSGGRIGILPNQGAGVFQALQPSDEFAAGVNPRFIAVGDVNVDGQPDLIVPNAGTNPGTANVLINTADPFFPPPSNDNFASAQVISGVSGRSNGDNRGATHEGSEPNHAGLAGFNSAWYSWTAPASGGATFDTFESTFDTALAVYTGSSVGALTEIASADNDVGANGESRRTSRVRFNAVAGTTYRIAVDSGSFGLVTGLITLNWQLLPPPGNDNFANAQLISGSTGTSSSTNAGATKQSGEPNHAGNAGGASIWYRWVAPSTGNFTFQTSSSTINGTSFSPSTYDTLLAIYTGSAVNALSPVVSNDDQNGFNPTSLVTLSATQGTTYQIAIDSKDSPKGFIVLSWAPVTTSTPHDSFANALAIAGLSGSASSEIASNNQAWFKWIAPASGTFSFSASPFQLTSTAGQIASSIAIFAADAQSNLTLVTENTTAPCRFGQPQCDPTIVQFTATNGVTYGIKVTRPGSAAGNAAIGWGAGGPPPSNDNLANALSFTGYGGLRSLSNSGATAEAGEPAHGGSAASRSLWYNWTAPATFNVVFTGGHFSSTGQGDFGSLNLSAYTGAGFPLTGIADGTVQISFNAVQGTTYRIAVDSSSTGFTSFIWQPSAAPANDNFVAAQTLSGSQGSTTGHNVNATRETGEPNHAGTPGSASIWYYWTPAANGPVTFIASGNSYTPSTGSTSFSGNPIDVLFGVYTGPNVSTLAPVAAGKGQVTFNAVAGTTYRLAIDTGNSQKGAMDILWGAPRTISGKISDIRGVGIGNIQLVLTGSQQKQQTTDHFGNFSFTNLLQGGNYTLTPDTSLFNFDLTSRTYNPLNADVNNANFVAQTPLYSIAGRLATTSQVGIGNVTVSLTGTNIPTGTSVQTTADGFYQFSNLATSGDFTVTPSSALYSFTATIFPANNSYSFPTLNTNIPNADFSGVANSFSISGQVTAGGAPVNGLTVSLTGTQSAMTTTNASGNYAFSSLTAGGSYTVTPSQTAQYSFTGQTIPSLQSNQTLNFAGALRNYTISGRATLNSAGLADVTVTLNGPTGFTPRTAMTAGDGSYSFANVPAASDYSVAAAKTYFTFNPATLPVTNLSADQTNVNFAATEVPKTFKFMDSNFLVNEGDVSALVTVVREGDPASAATVDFASSNGTASQLRDYEVANGTLTFAAGQTTRTFRMLIVDDVFAESNETINVTLSNPTNASLASPSTATVTILDNDSSGTTSPAARQFVSNLAGADEVPATPNAVKGNGGILQLSNDQLSAKVSLLFSGLTGSQTGAHVHAAAPGLNGPIIFPLPLGSPVNNFVVNPTAQQVLDLRAGQQYMNVHSSGFQNGEIRGQLLWNPAEEADFFVRQAYFDFLSRMPDPVGFAFWQNEITQCQTDVQCLRNKRVDVSNAFFYELEFQQTAAFVLRLYRGAYGNNQPFPNPNPNPSFPNEEKKLPSYAVFVADRARVIGGANLAQKQLDLANLFVTRPEFITKYPASLASADQFVDAVLATLQNDLSVNLSSQRANLITLYNQGGRGAVMYRLADDNGANPITNQPFIDEEYNRTFVLGQYFGYLRRNPDIAGFVFWLGQVNGAPLRDVNRQHAMVCSFITSGEYQFRFGPVASRNNNECTQ